MSFIQFYLLINKIIKLLLNKSNLFCLFQIETELYHINMSKKPILNNHIAPSVMSITRLPPNPSRVDRLIVESAKEYIRVTNLLTRIENLKETVFYPSIQATLHKWLDTIQKVYAKRREELVNNAAKQRIGQQNRVNDDKGYCF